MFETLLAALLLLAFFGVLTLRANELFCVSVRDGRVLLVRGRVPPSLLAEFADVVQRGQVQSALLRGVREGAAGRLLVEGADDFTAQRLRNVFGSRSWRDARLAPAPRRRNLGQRLGWVWLAWRLHQRRPD